MAEPRPTCVLWRVLNLKHLTIAFAILVLSSNAAAENTKPAPSQSASNFYVQRADTAIAIGVAVAAEFYGKKEIEAQKPYKAKRSGDHWVVTGSLKPGIPGGTFEVVISARDGAVIRMEHSQ